MRIQKYLGTNSCVHYYDRAILQCLRTKEPFQQPLGLTDSVVAQQLQFWGLDWWDQRYFRTLRKDEKGFRRALRKTGISVGSVEELCKIVLEGMLYVGGYLRVPSRKCKKCVKLCQPNGTVNGLPGGHWKCVVNDTIEDPFNWNSFLIRKMNFTTSECDSCLNIPRNSEQMVLHGR